MKRFFLCFICCALLVSGLSAQTNDDVLVHTNPRRQLATIIFSGLGGAILGLSTLSFYGRPQDRLNNIAIGFALGIIAGTVYSTYKTATYPYEMQEGAFIEENSPFQVTVFPFQERQQGTWGVMSMLSWKAF